MLSALNYLLRKQLITADHMNRSAVALDNSVHILAAGFMHLRILPERLEYLYGILPTVPVADPVVANRIAEVLRIENSSDTVFGSDKAKAVRHLYQYLMAEHATLRKRDVCGDPETTGAAYILKKIAICLQHFYSKGVAHSEDSDALDL